ncbi:Zinc finger protein [Nesidiocoris tenuis]|uniref:Zinc finger protein n=1 Tax=Nesidiocoris tenuis TaxID=355587 RepID=A0ABN7BF29_9HEMI|nr:Zinc finger protein [Nesidiocoris tenuis]
MAESSRNVIPLGGIAVRSPSAIVSSLPPNISASSKELLDLITTANRQAMPQYVGCLICQKEFKQKPTLLQHGCVHIEARPYPCNECGKRFRQQSHLTQHLRIHSDKKPFECMYCGKCFRQRTTLNQHLRIHTDEKPYKCTECGKDFRQKAILDQHYRTHLGDDRSYCCPITSCRRRFHTEEQMNRHIDNHPALRGEPGGPPSKRRSVEPASDKPHELYGHQAYSQQVAAAAAAFQQQYTMQLLQPHHQHQGNPSNSAGGGPQVQ